MAPLTVDPARLRAIAQGTNVIADGIAHSAQTIDGCAPAGEARLGGAADAFNQFHQLWLAELRTDAGAARQLAEALGKSADGYVQADTYASRRFG